MPNVLALFAPKFLVHDSSMTINQRIKDRRAALGLTLKEVADRCGLNAWQTVQAWERQSAPTRKRLTKVAEALQVSPEWLLTGRGPMEVSLVTAFSELTGSEAQLIMYFRNMTADEQAQVLIFSDKLSKQHLDAFGGVPLKLSAPIEKNKITKRKKLNEN